MYHVKVETIPSLFSCEITLTSSSLQPISRSHSTQWQWVSKKSGSSFSSPMSRGTEAVAPVSICLKYKNFVIKGEIVMPFQAQTPFIRNKKEIY